ncbi:MAG: hypothetical protein COZ05_22520 [Armatimonadetes bacterium CG_4_10_14_3_um_filter_59_10]|nr:MAG: hypothetical protein COZ56_19850 [Armatimonadetes bacterium CG_4_8_14_3_um_filter_58_9]PIY37365.1 MAG: hypothetical protein COZ05_22520 [Armatimonadetes bacterium CG_4_10_14_3_um_filter_59_10]
MLKIDLLPSYVREKQKVRKALMAMAVLLAVEVLGIGGFYAKRSKDLDAINKQIKDITPNFEKANEFEEKTNTEKGKLPPIASLVSKYKTCLDTQDKSVDVYAKIAEYTSAKAKLNGVQLDNSTATVSGTITGLDSLGQFLLNFMRCPAFTSVQFQADLQPFSFGGGGGGGQPGGAPTGAPPGTTPGPAPGAGPNSGASPQGAQVAASAGGITLPTREVSFTLTCTLAKPLPSPGAGAAGAAPGMEGMPPGGAAPPEGAAPAPPPGGGGGKAGVGGSPGWKGLRTRRAGESSVS